MRLFKFVSSRDAILSMAQGLLKFTPIDDLNDPSELTPIMDRAAVRSSLQTLRRNGHTDEQLIWLRHQDAIFDLLAPEEKVIGAPKSRKEADRILRSSIFDDLDYMERKLFSTIKLIRSRVGIMSLSERFDSLPMWAHYAKLAHGFVAVLDNLEDSFAGDATGSLNVTKRVTYVQRYIGMTFDPCTQDRIFFSKLSDWSYEREWRVVTALSACKKASNSNLFLRTLKRSPLRGVICGWRIREDEISALTNDLHSVDRRIQIILAHLDGGVVSLSPTLS